MRQALRDGRGRGLLQRRLFLTCPVVVLSKETMPKNYHLVMCLGGLLLGGVIFGMTMGALITCHASEIVPACIVFAATAALATVAAVTGAVSLYIHEHRRAAGPSTQQHEQRL